jgi:putative transposase
MPRGISSQMGSRKSRKPMESDGTNRRTRHSVRLRGFDYSRIGMYFVTICAAERLSLFGEVRGNKAVLSSIGEIVESCWIEIPRHFPGVKTEAHVVMPNHLHGILTIQSKRQDAMPQQKAELRLESFGRPTARSLPTIVRSFKSAVSKRVGESGFAIGKSIWQRGYYEHVLRNTQEYVEATNYILLNPPRWANDEENVRSRENLGAEQP